MLVHRLEKRGQQEQELPVFDRVFGRGKRSVRSSLTRSAGMGGSSLMAITTRRNRPLQVLEVQKHLSGAAPAVLCPEPPLLPHRAATVSGFLPGRSRRSREATVSRHGRIIFNGNNYAEAWVEEAKRRGLPILETAVEAFDRLILPENIALFERYGVFTPVTACATCPAYCTTAG